MFEVRHPFQVTLFYGTVDVPVHAKPQYRITLSVEGTVPMVFCAHWKEKLLFISRGRVSFFYPILDITSPSDRAVDKDPYSFSPPDPDPGEKNLRKKKKMQGNWS